MYNTGDWIPDSLNDIKAFCQMNGFSMLAQAIDECTAALEKDKRQSFDTKVLPDARWCNIHNLDL